MSNSLNLLLFNSFKWVLPLRTEVAGAALALLGKLRLAGFQPCGGQDRRRGEARNPSFSVQILRKDLPRAAAPGLRGHTEAPEVLLKWGLLPVGATQPALLSLSLPCVLFSLQEWAQQTTNQHLSPHLWTGDVPLGWAALQPTLQYPWGWVFIGGFPTYLLQMLLQVWMV